MHILKEKIFLSNFGESIFHLFVLCVVLYGKRPVSVPFALVEFSASFQLSLSDLFLMYSTFHIKYEFYTIDQGSEDKMFL